MTAFLYGHHSIEIGDEILNRDRRHERVSRPATAFDLPEHCSIDLHQWADLHERPIATASNDVASLRHDREAADIFFGGVRAIGRR